MTHTNTLWFLYSMCRFFVSLLLKMSAIKAGAIERRGGEGREERGKGERGEAYGIRQRRFWLYFHMCETIYFLHRFITHKYGIINLLIRPLSHLINH